MRIVVIYLDMRNSAVKRITKRAKIFDPFQVRIP